MSISALCFKDLFDKAQCTGVHYVSSDLRTQCTVHIHIKHNTLRPIALYRMNPKHNALIVPVHHSKSYKGVQHIPLVSCRNSVEILPCLNMTLLSIQHITSLNC